MKLFLLFAFAAAPTLMGCATADEHPSMSCADIRRIYVAAQGGFKAYQTGIRAAGVVGDTRWSINNEIRGVDDCQVKLSEDQDTSTLSCTTRYPKGAYRVARKAYDDLVASLRTCLTSAKVSTERDRGPDGSSRVTEFELDQQQNPYAVSIEVWMMLFPSSDGGGTHVWVNYESQRVKTTVRQ